MRWSTIFNFVTLILASSLLENVTAAPGKTNNINAGTFKKSSSTYRNAAAKNTIEYKAAGPALGVNAVPMKTTKAKAQHKGKDADHIFESQTLSTAVKKGGYTQKSDFSAAAMKDIKNVLNSPKNMVFVDPDVNRKKGQLQRSALSGKTPQVDPVTQDYISKTKPIAKQTAKELDAVLKKHNILGVDVAKEQKQVMKKLNIRRRLQDEDWY